MGIVENDERGEEVRKCLYIKENKLNSEQT